MAKRIADLLIKIGADTYGVTKMSADVRKQLNSLQKDLTGFGKSWSLYVTAPLTAAAGVAVKAADVQLKNEKRLLTALRGREDIQQRLIKQAGELQSRSLFGDEEVIGQQAYLAALGLTERQINDTIEAAAQLSSATGMTLDSAVKNLAKTYGGLSGELGESIPKLKELTAEQMKNGEAVKFVLENYKGFAESAAETGIGPLQQLKNSIGDVGEEVGKVLMPMIQAAARVLKVFAVWLQNLPPTAKTAIVVVGGLAAAVGPLAIGLGGIVKLLPALKIGLAALSGPAGLAAAAIGGLAYVFTAAKNAHQEFAAELADKTTLPELRQQLEEVQAKMVATPETISTQSSFGFYLSENPVYANLRKQEQALLAAIKIKTDAIEQEKKARAELESVIESLNHAETDQLGLIGRLEQKIKDLEVAKANAFKTFEIHNLTLEIASLRDELEKLQRIGSSEAIAGDTGNLFGKGGVSPLKFDPNAINPPESDWSEARANFAKNVAEFATEARTQTLDLAASIRGFLSDVATTIGEGLGNILSGDGTFDDLLFGILSAMGRFLKSLGQQLIQLGVMMIDIKTALASSFATPWTAIAVGVAAVALGAAMINSFNKRNEGGIALAEGGLAYGPTMALVGDNRGAGSDPEVIAPLSKLRQYGLGHQTIEFVGGTFRLSGSDLLLSVSREQAKINYVNALA